MSDKVKFRYAKIKRHDFDFPPYWVVVLDTMPRVLRYLEEVKSLILWNSLKQLKEKSKGTFHAFLDVNVGKESCVLDVAEATHLRDYLTQELKRRERRLKSGK